MSFIRRTLQYGLEYFGIYYSNYRGYVVSNKDPENMGRLLIKVPAVDGDSVDPRWVPPKGLWGGDDYGLHIIPNRGDVVWVEYLYGKANRPIWSHHGWAKEEMPKEFSNGSIYGFKTPLGHKVYIDDNTGVLKVELKDGEVITLEEGKIKIDAPKIELGTESIEPMLRGDQTYNLIKQLLTDLQSADVIVGGTAGIMGPNFQTAMTQRLLEAEKIKSDKTFTE